MTMNSRRLSLSHPAALALGALFALGACASTHAQDSGSPREPEATSSETTATTPAILLQYADVVSAGSTIYLTRTPVTTTAGSTTTTAYWDVTILVTIDPDTGKPTVAAGAVTAVPSPSLLVSAIKTGTYTALASGENPYGILVTGPGVEPGGSTYTVNPATGKYNLGPANSSLFWVGPLTNNPYITPARFEKAGITTAQGWSFGVNGSSYDSTNGVWSPNDIVGFKQVGDTVLIGDFTNKGTDQNTPVATFSYTFLN
jgi:hypothetical protein